MSRIPSLAFFSESDLARRITEWLVAGDLSQPAALAALGLTLIGVGLTSRSRARRRRVKQELVAQLRLGIQAAAERRASTARPTPATPARGTAEPAKPRVEPTAPAQAEASPGIPKREARARRAVKTPASEFESPRAFQPEAIEAQEELLDRIVKDAWGRALGGGRFSPRLAPRSHRAPDPTRAPCKERVPPTPDPGPPPPTGASRSVAASKTARASQPPAPKAEPRTRAATVQTKPSTVVAAAPGAPVARSSPPSEMSAPARPEPAEHGSTAETGAAAPEPLERALAEAWSLALLDGGEPEQPEAPSRSADPRSPSGGATSVDEYLRLCESLRAKDRPAEAARLAREGLATHLGESRLLMELSRAEAQAGRHDPALGAALAAHRARPSRAALTQLLQVATAARRFRPEDGKRLRRAVQRHPDAPVLLHAAGVFEAMHGDPWAAIGLLRTALRLEADEAIRGEIGRELARLESPAGDRAA